MSDLQLLQDLGWVVAGATGMLLVGRIAHIPPILGFILAGLLLGPVAGVLGHSESLDLFAELGIALLLFVVGLELSVAKIRSIGRTAVVGGLLQVGLTFGLGLGLALALGFAAAPAVLAGLVVAFSSTVVVVKLLDRTGDLAALHGRLAVGILLVQDVVIAVVLTVLGSLAGPEGVVDGAGGGLDAAVAGRGLLQALAGIAILAGVGWAAGRFLLRDFMGWMITLPEGLFVVALAWVMAFILGAEALQVSVELGAFIAGVILAQLPHCEELERRTHPLVDFFLAVFFVALGAGMELESMAARWPAALAFSGLILVGKPVVVALLLRLLGQAPGTAWLAGITLGQMSEFAFILAGLAASVGLVDPDFFGFVGLVGFLTIGVSAALVPVARPLAARLTATGLLQLLPGPDDPTDGDEAPLHDHVLVVGMNTLGREVVRRLHEHGDVVVAVDTDAGKLTGLPPGVRTLQGDLTHPAVLEESGLARAALLVSALRIEDANALLTYRCRSMGVPVSVHAFEPAHVEELLDLGADHLMISKLDGIGPMEAAVRRSGVMG